MSLVDAASLVREAHRNDYAVVQINTNGGTYDLTRAIFEVAEVGELGKLQADGTMVSSGFARAEDVALMSRESGVDFLAVGIGTAHGFYRETPALRFDLLEEYAKASAVPLVLHGTTGLSDDV